MAYKFIMAQMGTETLCTLATPMSSGSGSLHRLGEPYGGHALTAPLSTV